MHVAPACTESGEGSDHFGSYVCSLFLHFCKRLFPGLKLWVTRQHLYRCARILVLQMAEKYSYDQRMNSSQTSLIRIET
jgi:hypothetical protein